MSYQQRLESWPEFWNYNSNHSSQSWMQMGSSWQAQAAWAPTAEMQYYQPPPPRGVQPSNWAQHAPHWSPQASQGAHEQRDYSQNIRPRSKAFKIQTPGPSNDGGPRLDQQQRPIAAKAAPKAFPASSSSSRDATNRQNLANLRDDRHANLRDDRNLGRRVQGATVQRQKTMPRNGSQARLMQQEPSVLIGTRADSWSRSLEIESFFYRELAWVECPDAVPEEFLVALEGFFDRDVHINNVRDMLGAESAARLATYHCHEGPYTLYEVATTFCAGSSLIHTLANLAQEELIAGTAGFRPHGVRELVCPTMERLDRLQRCGAHGFPRMDTGKTPLHYLCQRCGSFLGYGPQGLRVLAWLTDRWPLSLLLEDRLDNDSPRNFGLWPAEYVLRTPCIGEAAVSDYGWYTFLAQGYARCLDLYPTHMERMLQLPRFRTVLQRLVEKLTAVDIENARTATLGRLCDADIEFVSLGERVADKEFQSNRGLGALKTIQMLLVSGEQAQGDIAIGWDSAAELHRRRRHALALQGLVGSCTIEYLPLERIELEAKLHEMSTTLDKHRAGSRAEIARLESELASARRDLAQKDQQVQALRDVAACNQAAGAQRAQETIGAGVVPQQNIELASSISPGVAHSAAADVVADLRRRRLVDVGELVSLPPEILQGVQSMQASLSRAVERLAKDLYTSDAHALHELLQNADDCKYASHEEPSVRFLLGKEARGTFFFAAESNELGFQEADVRALCDINASTKNPNDNAAIGQKGIGWKSLFLLSDRPFVLSHGYTFKFDIAGPLGLLGYVTPTWLSQDELDNLPQEIRSSWRNGKTVFFVPLRNASARLELEAELRQLCGTSEEERTSPPPLATSLLFFRRLRQLVVDVQVDSACSVSFTLYQHPADQHYVALCREGGGFASQRREVRIDGGSQHVYSHWFFVSSSHTPDGDIQLAFLLPSGDVQASEKPVEMDVGSDSKGLPLAWVFTFLPVRCIGFRFAVQAPFHLTASRGDVHNSSTKNLRLRDCLPAAFEDAVALESATCEKVGRKPYLAESSLMLLANDVVDVWWRPVRERILERVSKNMLCIPVEPRGVARLAESVLRGPVGSKGRNLTEFLSPDFLLRACGLHFVREDASTVSAEQLRQLGCASFSIYTALECLRNGWVIDMVGDDIRVDAFFRALYEFLLGGLVKDSASNVKDVPSDILDKIMSVPLFPVIGGECIPLKQGRLFRRFCSQIPESWQEPLAKNTTLFVLHPVVQSSSSPGVRTFLDKLHIEEPKLEDIVEQILQMYSDRRDRSKYCMQHWSASIACVRELWLRTSLRHQERFFDVSDVTDVSWSSHIVLNRLWPQLRNIVQLPNEREILMSPQQLDCPTLFGNACLLPTDVCQQIAALVGMDIDMPSELLSRVNSSVIAAEFLPEGERAALGRLESEAFLCSLGVRPMPLLSKESQVVSITLGTIFGSGKFWTALLESPKAASYVLSRLRSAWGSKREIEWLRHLDVQEGVSLKDLFLKHAFMKHGGRFLSYMDVPQVLHDLPDDGCCPLTLSSLAPADYVDNPVSCVTLALEILGVKIHVTCGSLLEVWRVLAHPRQSKLPTPRCASCEVYADLFQTIMQKLGDEPVPSVNTSYIYVPGFVGDACFVLSQQCVWAAHTEKAFVQLAGKIALEPHYGRFGDVQRQFFLRVARVPEKMVCKDFRIALCALLEQVEAATALLAMGASGDRAASAGAPEGGWAFPNPLDLPNQVHSLVKCIYGEIAEFVAAEDREAQPQRHTKPLPEEMIKGLEKYIKSGLGGSRSMTDVTMWFMDFYGGTPVNLREQLACSSEFEFFTEGDIGPESIQRLRLRRGSTDRYGEKQAAHRCFAESRLIVVPEHQQRKLPGGVPVAVTKRLFSGEAYWQVAPQLQRCQCAAWSLNQHYPPELRAFFLAVGVRPELTVEEFSRRLREKALEDLQTRAAEPPSDASTQATPAHAFHSDGYNLGDFIGGEHDRDFGAQLLNSLHSGDDPLSMTESYLQGAAQALDPSSATASAADFVRQEWIQITADILDWPEDANEATLEQCFTEPQAPPSRKLYFNREVGGLRLWSYAPRTSPMSGPALARAELCASTLRQVAERVFRFPVSALHLVDSGDHNEGQFCTGVFSARYRGALFIELPNLDQGLEANARDWATTELAHQLAHMAEGHAHSLRFCRVLEHILAPSTFGHSAA